MIRVDANIRGDSERRGEHFLRRPPRGLHQAAAPERDAGAATHGEDGGAMELFHRENCPEDLLLDAARRARSQGTARGDVIAAIIAPITTMAQTIVAPEGRSVTSEMTKPAP